ncbi:MAG: isochorismatase family cysteine hydrolase [Saprospiraceae bacterium]
MSDLLLVVDMQNTFVNEKVRPIIPNIIALINKFKAANRLIAFSRFINSATSNYVKLLQWDSCAVGAEIEIIPALMDYTKTAFVFDKPYYTPYTTEFKKYLTSNKITRIFICGVTTESCVLKAALDVFEDNKEPIVVENACYCDAGIESHKAGIFLISRNIGRKQVKSLQAVLEILN